MSGLEREIFGFRIGDRVVMDAGHAWAGSSGRVESFEPTAVSPARPVVRLDNGQRAFVMRPGHARVIES